jgi:hypothetical protein
MHGGTRARRGHRHDVAQEFAVLVRILDPGVGDQGEGGAYDGLRHDAINARGVKAQGEGPAK